MWSHSVAQAGLALTILPPLSGCPVMPGVLDNVESLENYLEEINRKWDKKEMCKCRLNHRLGKKKALSQEKPLLFKGMSRNNTAITDMTNANYCVLTLMFSSKHFICVRLNSFWRGCIQFTSQENGAESLCKMGGSNCTQNMLSRVPEPTRSISMLAPKFVCRFCLHLLRSSFIQTAKVTYGE